MLRWHDFAVLVRYEIPTVFLQSQYQQELLLFWPQLQIIPLRLSLRLRIFGEAVWSCCRLQANLRSKATCFRVSTKSQEKLNLHWVKIFLKGTFFFLHAPVTQWSLDVDERKKCARGLSSTQWYFNIFWVGKPKKQNVVTRAFRGSQGQRRPPSEGGWFWGWNKNFPTKKFSFPTLLLCVMAFFPLEMP